MRERCRLSPNRAMNLENRNKKSGLFTGRSLQRGEGGREISQERRCTMQSQLAPRHTDCRSLNSWKRVEIMFSFTCLFICFLYKQLGNQRINPRHVEYRA